MKIFNDEINDRLETMGQNEELKISAHNFMAASLAPKYSYNFSWLGRPIIQYPQDIVATQELIWSIQPDLIIETGIAHGGSLILSASLLELNAACGGPQDAEVLGLDIDIRAHNKAAIEAHPMYKRISMIEGSSIDPGIVQMVKEKAAGKKSVLVLLDSNHTHDHVLAELESYAPLVTLGSYCVVFDTVVEDIPKKLAGDRPWGPGNNPKTAVWEYLKSHSEFEIDKSIQHKLLITVAPDGYLKRIK
ncbi:MAG: cephalosporin hydroxylase family protein [Kiritimatiellia bacterium]